MQRRIVVTGGAGFVGSNLVDSLLRDGSEVVVFDSLVRPGSERNLAWLHARHPRVEFVHGDVRDARTVDEIVRRADIIYHFAAQVAVTTAIADPVTDFEVNALGTLNVLEAARRTGRPTLVLTSTNKVYGGIEDIGVVERPSRYELQEYPLGIPESQRLDFHSPYGCSKGAADQYVRDYGRTYELPTVVFRMSCVYGPRQFGNEDQGWLAHFIIGTIMGIPLTIYGDGKQVRDVLFVDDLVRALRLAADRIEVTAGKVYNIGGGPDNTLAVWSEFGPMLAELSGRPLAPEFGHWRPGDQRCYVSDIRKARRDFGWFPQIDKRTGVRRLWDWVSANTDLFELAAPVLTEGGVAGAVQ
jgi:CDP-paratose 2-epimerase